MISQNISIQDKEHVFYSSIKNEIEGRVETKLHSLYGRQFGEKLDVKRIEEECKHQFFEDLSKVLDVSIKVCGEFYTQLKYDDVSLYEKLQREISLASERIADIKSIRELTHLNKHTISQEDQKKIQLIGVNHFKEKDFEKAYLYFSFLSLADAENPQYWLVKGMAEQNLEKYGDALSSYSSVITLEPANLLAYLQIMDTLLLMKNFEGANQVYETFMREADPEAYAHNDYLISKLNVVRSFLTQPVF